MRYLDKFIENPQQGIFNRGHGIFIVGLPIPLQHLINQKRIFELIMHGIVPLIFNHTLDGPQRFHSETVQENLILLNGSVDEFSDDVAEQRGVGLTELLDVEFVAVEGLDLFVVFLGHDFTEFVKEDVLRLVYTVCLCLDEVSDSNTGMSSLGEIQQFATILEVDFPRV